MHPVQVILTSQDPRGPVISSHGPIITALHSEMSGYGNAPLQTNTYQASSCASFSSDLIQEDFLSGVPTINHELNNCILSAIGAPE